MRRLQLFLGLISITSSSIATDFECLSPHSISSSTIVHSTNPVTPLSDTKSEISGVVQPLMEHGTTESGGLVPLINHGVEKFSMVPLQQVNEKAAREQVEGFRNLSYSAEELKRQQRSEGCNKAFNDLNYIFNKQRKTMQFWSDSKKGLAHFIPWYFQPNLNELQRNAAQPVIEAQKLYEQHCLVNHIPEEMNPTLIKQAVGLLLFEKKSDKGIVTSKVICTGLRIGKETIYTAKHCFLNPETGAENTDMASVIKGQGKFWFVYEAEPLHRFEVCTPSLPKSQEPFPVLPAQDYLKISVAPTVEPVAPIKWVTSPKTGISLYLRGYYPLASGPDLQRLVATAHGGCVVLDAKDSCLFHACQTTPVMSGAPVFLRPEPGDLTKEYLEPVALHLGSAGMAANSNGTGAVCKDVDGNKLSLGNFAYKPPKEK